MVFSLVWGINCLPLVSFRVAERGKVPRQSTKQRFHIRKVSEMKKFAAILMLVCSLGVFAIVGCGGDTKTPATPPKTDDKMAPAKTDDKMAPATPPATTPAPADKK